MSHGERKSSFSTNPAQGKESTKWLRAKKEQSPS